MSRIAAIMSAIACMLLAGDAGTAGEDSGARAWQKAPPDEFDSYHLVLLTAGDATNVDPDRKSEAFAGHQAHMLRRYRAGELLTPARVEQIGEVDIRGLLIYRGDLDDAQVAEIVREDPLVQLGVLKARITRMHTPKGIIAWK